MSVSLENQTQLDFHFGFLRSVHRWSCGECRIHGPWLYDEAGRSQVERAAEDHRALHEEFARNAPVDGFWDWVVRVSSEAGHALLEVAGRAVRGPWYR